MKNAATSGDAPETLDVIVVGAGLSGVAAGYHLQRECPQKSYTILEARAAIGGTWDLFRYPGIRSDSDMFTLGYSFRPWKEQEAIADGPAILSYVRETAEAFGIDQKIRFHHKVVSAAWSSDARTWTVAVERTDSGEVLELRCSFLMMCSGYYDYDAGYTPDFPGRQDFPGEVVHPQHWPEDLDVRGKRVVVIGSGATAVTLVPELAAQAEHVVMLQRSPSYVISMPSVDPVSEWLRARLPPDAAYDLVRWKNVVLSLAMYKFCRAFPDAARKMLVRQVERHLDGKVDVSTHFNPRYNPWEQRLCLVPDGDLFDVLRDGRAQILTDQIASFTTAGIRLASGKQLDADIIVTATGLRLKFLAGLRITVDGREVRPSDTIPYKGVMLSGVPNLGMAFGYTNASWTLKCDLSCAWVSRMLREMDEDGQTVVMPVADPPVSRIPLVDFSSGYFKRAEGKLPQQGHRAPWKVYQNYVLDWIMFRIKPIHDEGLEFR